MLLLGAGDTLGGLRLRGLQPGDLLLRRQPAAARRFDLATELGQALGAGRRVARLASQAAFRLGQRGLGGRARLHRRVQAVSADVELPGEGGFFLAQGGCLRVKRVGVATGADRIGVRGQVTVSLGG